MLEGLHKIISSDETIVAISTAQSRSAIGVIRISGCQAVEIARRLFKGSQALEHRQVRVGKWHEPSGEILDEVVVTLARHPHSYTGEDLIEISAHGNPLTLNRLVKSIIDSGARPAAPGEFTLRAVTNGKMDLIQAEAVGKFVEAQTEQQARTALRQLEGAGAKRIHPIKQALLDIIARLEAGIDFAEDDVDVPDGEAVFARTNSISASLTTIQESFGYGRILMEGVRVTILGKPNVGKSSIFNRLLQSERAIVTDVPGTTRDVLAEVVNLDGIPLRLMDTAGLRETSDKVEQIGVIRSLESVAGADLALIVLDGSRPLDRDDEEVLKQAATIPNIVVINKSDLPQALQSCRNGSVMVRVSALTSCGMDDLRRAILDFLMERHSDLTEDFVLTSARQNEALSKAITSLNNASNASQSGVPHEMLLLDLYGALAALYELTGEVVTEDILDRIFSTFCIGK